MFLTCSPLDQCDPLKLLAENNLFRLKCWNFNIFWWCLTLCNWFDYPLTHVLMHFLNVLTVIPQLHKMCQIKIVNQLTVRDSEDYQQQSDHSFHVSKMFSHCWFSLQLPDKLLCFIPQKTCTSTLSSLKCLLSVISFTQEDFKTQI